MMIGASCGNRGDEEVLGRYDVKERNTESSEFCEKGGKAVVNMYFKKRA